MKKVIFIKGVVIFVIDLTVYELIFGKVVQLAISFLYLALLISHTCWKMLVMYSHILCMYFLYFIYFHIFRGDISHGRPFIVKYQIFVYVSLITQEWRAFDKSFKELKYMLSRFGIKYRFTQILALESGPVFGTVTPFFYIYGLENRSTVMFCQIK